MLKSRLIALFLAVVPALSLAAGKVHLEDAQIDLQDGKNNYAEVSLTVIGESNSQTIGGFDDTSLLTEGDFEPPNMSVTTAGDAASSRAAAVRVMPDMPSTRASSRETMKKDRTPVRMLRASADSTNPTVR